MDGNGVDPDIARLADLEHRIREVQTNLPRPGDLDRIEAEIRALASDVKEVRVETTALRAVETWRQDARAAAERNAEGLSKVAADTTALLKRVPNIVTTVAFIGAVGTALGLSYVKLISLDAQISAAATKVESAAANCQQASDRATAIETELTSSLGTLNSSSQAIGDKAIELGVRTKDIGDRVTEFKEPLAGLQARVGALADSKTAIDEKLARLETTMSSLSDQASKLGTTALDLQDSKLQMGETLKTLSDQAGALQKTADEIRNVRASLDDKNAQLEDLLKRFKDLVAALAGPEKSMALQSIPNAPVHDAAGLTTDPDRSPTQGENRKEVAAGLAYFANALRAVGAEVPPEIDSLVKATKALDEGRYEDAIASARKAEALDVDKTIVIYAGIVADAQRQLGRFEEAIQTLQDCLDQRCAPGSEDVALVAGSIGFTYFAWARSLSDPARESELLGLSLKFEMRALALQHDSVLRYTNCMVTLNSLKRYDEALDLAAQYAGDDAKALTLQRAIALGGLGRDDEAIGEVEKALADEPATALLVASTPEFEGLHGVPRFTAALRQAMPKEVFEVVTSEW